MAIKVTLFIVFILAIFVFAGLAAWRWWRVADDDTPKWTAILFTVLAPVFIFLTILIPGNIHQVNTGDVAVVRHMGKVTGTREPGIYWDWYFTTDYITYPTTVQEISLDSLAYSSDTQYVALTAEMQYKIKSDKADYIESEYRGVSNLESKIKVVALDKVKAVYAKYKATEIMENRDAISNEVASTVKAAVEAAYPVELNTCAVPNIDFSDTFEKSVEDALAAKVKAQQEAQQAEAEAEKARIQADAALYKAEKEAEARLVEAQKEAEAIVAKSKANAEAELLLADANAMATKLKSGAAAKIVGFDVNYVTDPESGKVTNVEINTNIDGITSEEREARIKLMTAYLQYMQYLETWDGTLPVTLVGDDTATIVIPNKN